MKKKLLLGLLLLALLGGLVWYYWQRRNPSPDYEPGFYETTLDSDGADQTDEASTSQTGTPTNDDQSGGGSSGQSSKKEVSVTLTRLDTSENLVMARGFADTSQSGICTLVLEQGSQKLTYQEETQFETNYVSCNPFDVPKSDFPSSGTWQGKIIFESKDYRGESQQMEVTL